MTSLRKRNVSVVEKCERTHIYDLSDTVRILSIYTYTFLYIGGHKITINIIKQAIFATHNFAPLIPINRYFMPARARRRTKSLGSAASIHVCIYIYIYKEREREGVLKNCGET